MVIMCKKTVMSWCSNYIVVFLMAFFVIPIFLSGCATVPLTERRSLHLVPDSELLTLSFQEYKKILSESRLSRNQRQVQLVKNVGFKIARAAEAFLKETGKQELISKYRWEFNLIEDDKTVNAWVLPGGKAAVYTGILPFTRDETGLAVVLGHEVAHAIANHGNERMSNGLLSQMGGTALSIALANNPQMTQQIFMTVFGIGARVGFLLPYSRLQESEADKIGLILMARAGYDPNEAITFWKRMSQQGGVKPPEFLSTHPAPETRINNIRKSIPEAMRYYRK